MTIAVLAIQPVLDLLDLVTRVGGFDFQYEISLNAGCVPELTVEFSGADVVLLIARNGELLHAMEHIAAKILHLEPEEHDRISFDADHFKAKRVRALQQLAEAAVARVRCTGKPYAFEVMTSRERRILHLALKESGLPTASSGVGPRRFVVLYPEGFEPVQPTEPVIPDRAHRIRNAFRRRNS